jgi:Domain of unknown function (DUF4337)
MGGAHEAMEISEHTTHAAHEEHGKPHGGAGSNKLIGMTIALIGVLLAFCAAMVGSERNELVRAMIEQTQSHSDYTSASTKFRLIMLDIEKERAVVAASTGDTAAPNPLMKRLLRLYLDYSAERKLSQAWADTYQPLIDAHFGGAEAYEKAQLLAEIGIVFASVAVLLGSRISWIVSLVLATLCVGQLGRSYFHVSHVVHETEAKIEQSKEAYQDLRKAHTGANEDEKTIEACDPGGKIRASFQEGAPAAEGSEAKAEEHHH